MSLLTDFDATVWAKEFIKCFQENPAIATDVETMTSWFANAIMVGYDKKQSELGHEKEKDDFR